MLGGGLMEVYPAMVHFTCDVCGKELGDDRRFVVRIEAFTAYDPAEITEADLDEDHLEAVSQLLRDMEDEDLSVPQSSQSFRYDLCPECHERFIRDPLGKDQLHKLFFSNSKN